jgi:hypothetical protein
MKNNNVETEHLETGNADKAWFGIAVAGVIAAACSVYLCHYSYSGGFAQNSWPVTSAGLGLIIAFCVLTVTLIAGIKAFIVRRWRRFWPVSTMIVSGLSLIGLAGISILGIIL